MVVVDHGQAILLGDGGINVVVGVADVDLDVGVDGLGALDVADEEVVDDGGIHAADEADDGILIDLLNGGIGGQGGGKDAHEVAHVVLLVGDVHDIGALAGVGVVVEDDVLLIGILIRDFLQEVGHLVGTADDDVILTGSGDLIEGVLPLGLVFIQTAHLDGGQGDAAVSLQLIEAGLGGVKEGLVAQVAVDEVDNVVNVGLLTAGGARGGAGGGGGVLVAAGSQRQRHDQREEQCCKLLHEITSRKNISRMREVFHRIFTTLRHRDGSIVIVFYRLVKLSDTDFLF